MSNQPPSISKSTSSVRNKKNKVGDTKDKKGRRKHPEKIVSEDDGGSGSGSDSDEDIEDSDSENDRLRTRKTAPEFFLDKNFPEGSGKKSPAPPANSKNVSSEKDGDTLKITPTDRTRSRSVSKEEGRFKDITKSSKSTQAILSESKKVESVPHSQHRVHKRGEEKTRKSDQISRKKYDTFDFDERKVIQDSSAKLKPTLSLEKAASTGHVSKKDKEDKEHTHKIYLDDEEYHPPSRSGSSKVLHKKTGAGINLSDKPDKPEKSEDKVSRFKSTGTIAKPRRKSDFTPQRRIHMDTDDSHTTPPSSTTPTSSTPSKTKAKKQYVMFL